MDRGGGAGPAQKRNKWKRDVFISDEELNERPSCSRWRSGMSVSRREKNEGSGMKVFRPAVELTVMCVVMDVTGFGSRGWNAEDLLVLWYEARSHRCWVLGTSVLDAVPETTLPWPIKSSVVQFKFNCSGTTGSRDDFPAPQRQKKGLLVGEWSAFSSKNYHIQCGQTQVGIIWKKTVWITKYFKNHHSIINKQSSLRAILYLPTHVTISTWYHKTIYLSKGLILQQFLHSYFFFSSRPCVTDLIQQHFKFPLWQVNDFLFDIRFLGYTIIFLRILVDFLHIAIHFLFHL